MKVVLPRRDDTRDAAVADLLAAGQTQMALDLALEGHGRACSVEGCRRGRVHSGPPSSDLVQMCPVHRRRLTDQERRAISALDQDAVMAARKRLADLDRGAC